MQCEAMDASKKEDGTAEKEGDVAMDPSGDAAPKKTESKNLDLVFAMDCTGSMSSYIYQAQQVWSLFRLRFTADILIFIIAIIIYLFTIMNTSMFFILY